MGNVGRLSLVAGFLLILAACAVLPTEPEEREARAREPEPVREPRTEAERDFDSLRLALRSLLEECYAAPSPDSLHRLADLQDRFVDLSLGTFAADWDARQHDMDAGSLPLICEPAIHASAGIGEGCPRPQPRVADGDLIAGIMPVARARYQPPVPAPESSALPSLCAPGAAAPEALVIPAPIAESTAAAALTLRREQAALEIKTYFPVTEGRWFLYQNVESGSEEKVTIESMAHSDGITRLMFRMEDAANPWSRGVSSCIMEIDGESIRRTNGTDREVLLRFPLREDDEWSWKGRNEIYHRRILSTCETVKVPAGTFTDCVIVEMETRLLLDGERELLTSRAAYAPGIGLVRLEYLQPEYRSFGIELSAHGTEASR